MPCCGLCCGLLIADRVADLVPDFALDLATDLVNFIDFRSARLIDFIRILCCGLCYRL